MTRIIIRNENLKMSRLHLSILMLTTAVSLAADTITMRNGTVVEGTLLKADTRTLTFMVGDNPQAIAISDIESVRFGNAAAPAAPPPVATHALSIPFGTPISVRLVDAFDSQTGTVGKEYRASIDDPVVVDGNTVLAKDGAAFVTLVEAKQAGKLAGRPQLTLSLARVEVNGHSIALQTSETVSQGDSKGKQSAVVIGAAAAGGAGIGALLGRGKGALIGGATVAGTAAAVQALRPKPGVKIPSETRLTFTLSQPATLP